TPHSGLLGSWPHSAPNYLDLSRDTRQLENLAAISFGSALLNLPEQSVQVSQIYVTGNFFATLAVNAELGRFITLSDDRPDAPMVGVISDELWRERFG